MDTKEKLQQSIDDYLKFLERADDNTAINNLDAGLYCVAFGSRTWNVEQISKFKNIVSNLT